MVVNIKPRPLGTDPKTDLAVIKVKAEGEKLPTIPWGTYEKLRVGDVVLALGSPFGLEIFGVLSELLVRWGEEAWG